MEVKSRIVFLLFFVAIACSIALIYYHTIVLQDFIVFTDPNDIPDPTDFIANMTGFLQE